MTPAPEWTRRPEWAAVPLWDPVGADRPQRVVVVVPPGDESSGPGGLVEMIRRAGVPVTTVVGTVSQGSESDQEKELTTRVVEAVGDGRATLLLAPHPTDGDPGHETLARSAQRAAYRTGATLVHHLVRPGPRVGPDDVPWDRLRRVVVRGVDGVAAPDERDEPDEVVVIGEPRDDALDDLHGEHLDPWGTTTRWYERRKRGLLLAMLPRPRFGRALDLGCSTGTLTVELAARCDGVVAMDSSPHALEAAATATRDLGNVELRRADLDSELPGGGFDLAVLSEVGYFLSPVALDRLAARLADALTPDGCLVLAHWRHPIVGWPLTGADVHDVFARAPGLPPVTQRHVERDVEIVVHAHEATPSGPQ